MRSFTGLLGLAVVILLLFLMAAYMAQGWLQRQHQQIQRAAIETRRQQFQAAAKLASLSAVAWNADQLQTISQLINARVSLHPAGASLPDANPGWVAFRESLTNQDGTEFDAFIVFQLPHLARLSLLHGRFWTVLLIGALAVMLLFILCGLFYTRRSSSGSGSQPPWSKARSEMNSWEHLAKTSVSRSHELATERDNRLRIEKDLYLTQQQQTKALEEKIRLGRDLHDGVIQSLYAVGLTLEAARTLMHKDVTLADQRLQQCLDRLNSSIRDVRTYISGLSPEKLRQMNFANAVESFGEELGIGREVTWDLVIDEDAATALNFEQTTEALQVTREAISNALRHGKANAITVRLHRNEREVGLLVRDNGKGFQPERLASAGHGLANMQGRAAHIGATLRIDSQPNEGTRIVMTFPVSPSL